MAGRSTENGTSSRSRLLVLVAVADDGEPHFAVLQARHGRRQEARVEENVGLDRAGTQMVELLDQVEAGRGRVDGQPAQRPVTFQQLDVRLVADRGGHAGQLGDHRAGRAAAHLLDQRYRGHQCAAFSPGMKIAMTMPSLRQTVKESAAASNIIDTAVAMAAPHRPSIGMRMTLSEMLRTSVSA